MIVVLNIVLLEPEMPANTGNIGRTCCATGTRLHLIEPMGFRINDKMLKRAGLDYWEHLDVTIYDSYEDFLEKNPKARDKMYMATTKARHRYTDVPMRKMRILCSVRRVQGFRKKFWCRRRTLRSVFL